MTSQRLTTHDGGRPRPSRLAETLQIDQEALDAAGIDADATPDEARRAIKARYPGVWRRIAAQNSRLGASRVLLEAAEADDGERRRQLGRTYQIQRFGELSLGDREAAIAGHCEVLVAAGLSPGAKPTRRVIARVRRLVGDNVWSAAVEYPHVIGARRLVVTALQSLLAMPEDDEPKKKRSKRKARKRYEDEPADESPEDEDAEDEDEDDGDDPRKSRRARRKMLFGDEDDDAMDDDDDEDEDDEDDDEEQDEPASPKGRKSRRRAKDSPEDEAMFRRIAANTGRPIADVRRAHRAINHRPATAKVTRLAPAKPKANSSRAGRITAEDRRVAQRQGLDPADVARSRRALGLGEGD